MVFAIVSTSESIPSYRACIVDMMLSLLPRSDPELRPLPDEDTYGCCWAAWFGAVVVVGFADMFVCIDVVSDKWFRVYMMGFLPYYIDIIILINK